MLAPYTSFGLSFEYDLIPAQITSRVALGPNPFDTTDIMLPMQFDSLLMY